MASCRPTKRLKIDDLPALVRPTMATMGSFLFDMIVRLYHKMEWYNSRMKSKEIAGCRNIEQANGRLLKKRVISEIQQAASPEEVDNIVQWMCANPSLEWPAVIYKVNQLPDFPAKSMFMGKVDKIYVACSDIVADSDGQVATQ